MFLPDEFYPEFEKRLIKEKYSVSKDILREAYIDDLRRTEKKYSKEDLVKGRIVLFKIVDLLLDELDARYKNVKSKSELNYLNNLAKHLRVKRHHKSGFVKKYRGMFESVERLCNRLDLL